VVADVGVAASSILHDSGSSASRRPEERVRDFSRVGTGSVESSRPTEKEVGVLIGSSSRTGAGVGERGGGVSRPMLPKMTFWFVAGRSCTGAEEDLF
jgi:hypothetical protein